jgi:hypothetical protein
VDELTNLAMDRLQAGQDPAWERRCAWRG